jgi:uncharacterized Zn-binding protein involved in type VI secretion
MPAVCRLDDVSQGHCFESRKNIEASSNVFINGKGVHLVGHAWPTHTCGNSSHASKTAEGSPNVFANGKAVARIGDALDCGDKIAEGSPNVFAN